MSKSFVHLHCHSEYSILDGAAKVNKMVGAAVRDAQPALAITDHGNCYGLLEHYKACDAEGIKPILGIEAYMAFDNVDERPPKKKAAASDGGGGDSESGRKINYHLSLLAENNTGYQNLLKLSSEAFLRGYYYKPRVDWDILSRHSEGLIASTGCLGGITLQHLLRGEDADALAAAARLQDIFGHDNLFVELQDHGIPEQAQTNPKLIEIAKKLNAPLIATNDSHYVDHSDHLAHDSLLCLQTGARIADTDRFKFASTQHYIKTASEMRYLFREVEVACDNTLLIAERADVNIEFGRNLVPKFDVPDGYENEEDYLRALVFEGAQQRWVLTEEVTNRIEYELETIVQMGFAGYFLIVWDLLRHANSEGIRVGPARGSAGGSAVSYALSITEIDPLRWNLLFERFLNPSRVSMPDIDIDIDSRYREHMINYTTQKYGDDRVARIITLTQIKSRSALRDAARVLGEEYSAGDKLARELPPLLFGKDTPIEACLNEDPKYADSYLKAGGFRRLYNNDEPSKRIVDVAIGLEGLRRSDGIHAAAVVIAPDVITNFLPVQQKTIRNTKVRGPIVTQYEMHGVEDLGLVKMDFLGLRNLNVITDACKMAGITISKDSFDDPAVYELLGEGDTVGVFQLESTPMRSLLFDLKPDCFEDIAAVLALYRPGPMAANMHNDFADRKHGRQPSRLFHPDAKEILAETHGLMIYQEQVMAVAQKFAGYSGTEADNLRRSMGKKITEEMDAEESKFIAGVVANGYKEEMAIRLFATMAEFANYAFTSAHAFGYAITSYQTAFLKVHHPTEYMAALMTSVQNDHHKLTLYLNEAKKMGINVTCPDINKSEVDFAPSDKNTIVFGLLGIKDVGPNPAHAIVADRSENGDYETFVDYARRGAAINKKTVGALVKSGAFDNLGHPRRGLHSVSEFIVKAEGRRRHEEEHGVQTLFEMEADAIKAGIPDLQWSEEDRLALEKECLGVYVTGHPMSEVKVKGTNITIGEISEMDEANWLRFNIAGIILDKKEVITKKGDRMMTFHIEDTSGNLPCVLFPRQTNEFGALVNEEDIVYLDVRPQDDRSGVKLIVNKIKPLKGRQVLNEKANVHVYVPEGMDLNEVKSLIRNTRGSETVILHYAGSAAILPKEYQSSIEAMTQEV